MEAGKQYVMFKVNNNDTRNASPSAIINFEKNDTLVFLLLLIVKCEQLNTASVKFYLVKQIYFSVHAEIPSLKKQIYCNLRSNDSKKTQQINRK